MHRRLKWIFKIYFWPIRLKISDIIGPCLALLLFSSFVATDCNTYINLNRHMIKVDFLRDIRCPLIL